jgi:hypothetical protein
MRDKLNTFSDAQTMIINSGASADGTNVLDLTSGNGKDALGTARVADPVSPGLAVEFLITTTLVGNTAVLTLAVYEHTAASSISSGNLITDTTLTIGTDTVTAGTRVTLPLPVNKINERYMNVHYAVATANITAGAMDATLTNSPEKFFP